MRPRLLGLKTFQMRCWDEELLAEHIKKLAMLKAVRKNCSRRNVGLAPRSVLFGLYTNEA
eukprot:6457922-Amphidinium_carterae.3